jgi:hypothetical protein
MPNYGFHAVPNLMWKQLIQQMRIPHDKNFKSFGLTSGWSSPSKNSWQAAGSRVHVLKMLFHSGMLNRKARIEAVAPNHLNAIRKTDTVIVEPSFAPKQVKTTEMPSPRMVSSLRMKCVHPSFSLPYETIPTLVSVSHCRCRLKSSLREKGRRKDQTSRTVGKLSSELGHDVTMTRLTTASNVVPLGAATNRDCDSQRNYPRSQPMMSVLQLIISGRITE